MIIDGSGNRWYKGNLHTHTTNSDGLKSPEEALKLYKSLGCDFIALTDHWYFGAAGEYDGMLVLSGAEYDNMKDGCYHVVGYGMTKEPKLIRGEGPQTFIDEIKRCGGVATLAHPAWSMQRPDEMVKLKGVDCTEIYNSVSGYPYSARPYSGLIIDTAAVMGFRATLTAVDDTHFYGDEIGRGFVYVKAEELCREAILKAILDGDVLATNGPFVTAGIEDGYFTVRCDKGCRYVQFFSNLYFSPETTKTGGTLYEARFKLTPKVRFIRAEAVDFEGRTAYTQYYYPQI